VSARSSSTMSVAWLNPSFLYYRVPVYAALDRLLANQLTVVFSASRMLPSVVSLITEALGSRAVALSGERQLRVGGGSNAFANQGYNVPFQRGLFKAIRGVRPDVIISEGFFQWTPAALWWRRKHGTPVVVSYECTAHTERRAGPIRTSYRRWAARHVDAICCNGLLSRAYCTEVLGIDPARIVTGAMAADSKVLAVECQAVSADVLARQFKALDLCRPVFACVGRLVKRKGVRELLAAWELLAGRRPATRGSLLFVGDGPERQELERLVKQHSLPGVAFAGAVDYQAIALYYALCDVLVVPTLEDNWSLVVPEAMACSKPVLCSRFNGCWPELVKDGVNGWTFDPLNQVELAGLFERCVARTDMLPAMGEASRRIVADFTPEHAAGAFLRACALALGREVPSPGSLNTRGGP
jgi:glycosyltransferase involved in cell wall biosynthesis